MKSPSAPIPGAKAPASRVAVARAEPQRTLRIFEDVKTLIALETVAAGIDAEQVAMLQRRDIIRSCEMIKSDSSRSTTRLDPGGI